MEEAEVKQLLDDFKETLMKELNGAKPESPQDEPEKEPTWQGYCKGECKAPESKFEEYAKTLF